MAGRKRGSGAAGESTAQKTQNAKTKALEKQGKQLRAEADQKSAALDFTRAEDLDRRWDEIIVEVKMSQLQAQFDGVMKRAALVKEAKNTLTSKGFRLWCGKHDISLENAYKDFKVASNERLALYKIEMEQKGLSVPQVREWQYQAYQLFDKAEKLGIDFNDKRFHKFFNDPEHMTAKEVEKLRPTILNLTATTPEEEARVRARADARKARLDEKKAEADRIQKSRELSELADAAQAAARLKAEEEARNKRTRNPEAPLAEGTGESIDEELRAAKGRQGTDPEAEPAAGELDTDVDRKPVVLVESPYTVPAPCSLTGDNDNTVLNLSGGTGKALSFTFKPDEPDLRAAFLDRILAFAALLASEPEFTGHVLTGERAA